MSLVVTKFIQPEIKSYFFWGSHPPMEDDPGSHRSIDYSCPHCNHGGDRPFDLDELKKRMVGFHRAPVPAEGLRIYTCVVQWCTNCKKRSWVLWPMTEAQQQIV